MIIVKLMGGLGNQMFQYAAARAQALDRKTWVYLDPSFLYEDSKGQWTQREYALSPFNIQYKFERSGRVKFLRALNNNRFWRKLSGSKYWFLPYKNFVEQSGDFDKQLKNYPSNTYLQGYFQSEKYFLHHASQIRQDFSFIDPPSEVNAEWLVRIRQENSVSVHVRRGDYVSLASANAFHGTLSLDYYAKSAQLLRERLSGDLSFFVFSDDPEWVKSNLVLPGNTTYVDWNGEGAAHEDLRLMSNCRHNIIANSSFSWWGAWLGENADKLVVAPKQWFTNGNPVSEDLIPRSWIKV